MEYYLFHYCHPSVTEITNQYLWKDCKKFREIVKCNLYFQATKSRHCYIKSHNWYIINESSPCMAQACFTTSIFSITKSRHCMWLLPKGNYVLIWKRILSKDMDLFKATKPNGLLKNKLEYGIMILRLKKYAFLLETLQLYNVFWKN